MQIKYIPGSLTDPPGWLRKAAAAITTVALATFALIFSAVLLSIILTIGGIAWIYLWWKTRAVRKQMQQFMPGNESMEGEAFEGEVFEGEVVRVQRIVESE